MAASDHLSGMQFDALDLAGRSVADRPYMHGTNAVLKHGDVINPGHTPTFNTPSRDDASDYVYSTRAPSSAKMFADTRASKHGGTPNVYAVEHVDAPEPDPETAGMSGYNDYRSRQARVVGTVDYSRW